MKKARAQGRTFQGRSLRIEADSVNHRPRG